jgi:dihydroorotase
MEFAEDSVPARAAALTQDQLKFLEELACVLQDTRWELNAGKEFDYDKALVLQQRFHEARLRTGLSVAIALESVYSCFAERRFSLQIGLFLLCIDRDLFFKRISEITQQHKMGASA